MALDSFNLVVCILCIICGILSFIGAVLWMNHTQTFVSILLGIYIMIFSLYIILVEIFMPLKIRSLLAFYLTWTGKAVFFIFIGVLLVIPYEGKLGAYHVYYLVAAIFLFVVAIGLIILQVIGCLGKVRSRGHPIIYTEAK